MMRFFTSDTHFSHKNIISFCKRPFKDIIEMNIGIIEQWNSQVSEIDEVYHLGDFSFARDDITLEILSLLNGKIHLILGNHDKSITKNPELMSMFESVESYKEIYIENKLTVLFHYPIEEWNRAHHGAFHLHGHQHNSPSTILGTGRCMDVGVDGNLGRLWTEREIAEILDKRPFTPHH